MAAEPMQLPKVSKLTKWAKEPSVLTLKEDLEASKPAHDVHVARVRRWNALRDVTGEFKPKKIKGRSSVQPKLVRRQAEWRYSALSEPFLSDEKFFKASPETFEDVFAAQQNELVLNHQFRTKLNPVKLIDEYVHTAVDEGSVVVRLGWCRKTRKRIVQNPIFQYALPLMPEELQPLEQALQARETNYRSYLELAPELKAAVDYYDETGQATIATVVGMEEVEEDELVMNQPTVQILDPANVYIDPSCEGDLDKARFVIVSFETSKAELLKDGRYKNLDAINWSGNTILGQPDHATKTPSDFNFKDDLRKRVVAYEYWGYYDVEGEEELKPIVATWIGDVMIRMEENPFPDEKPPFVVVPYLPIKRQVMGEPDAELLEDNQAILGAISRGMIDLMGRSANAQQGYSKQFLDPINKRRFENGEDYEFNPGGDPRLSIYQHTYPEIPASAMNMAMLQNQEAEALTGVKSFSGGISGDAYGEVAAGIRGMLDAASKREMSILRRLAQGMKEIGIKIAAMNAVFLAEEEVIRITNENFVPVRREDLKGNFDIIIDIATPEVDEAKSQDLGFMLQTLGPDMAPALSGLILAEIARLKRMPDLAKQILNFKPEPDPTVEALKQLEIQKAQKELEKLDSEIELNRARARKEQAQADKTDLDFVEQESGTKHERDLQKQAEQARANQDLEVTKGLLKTQKKEERAPDVEAAIGYNRISEQFL